VQELAAMLARRERGEEDFVLVDVREPAEHDIVRIPGSVLVPKEQILRGAALPELPQDRRIVLHCRSGARSAEVLEVLRGAGFRDAVHVDGGVLAWAEQIDPSLPTY
jgi:adenylyltransferase/sulfurtransferase